MKNTLDTMRDIVNETYKQIEDNLPSGEFLISKLTIYDKNNAVSTNLFLTNQAIFLQESNELEKIKKRRFDKINDIKLTNTELYIEFVNGYKIIGDVVRNLNEAEKFFNDIKSNTKIKASSVRDLSSEQNIPEVNPIKRQNKFLAKEEKKVVPTEVIGELAPTEEFYEEETKKQKKTKEKKNKKSKASLIIGIIISCILIIGGVVAGILLLGNKDPEDTELENKIILVQAKADELLQYQLANNKFYDYVFDLQYYYDEVTTNLANANISLIEEEFGSLQKDFEDNYLKEFKTNNNIYAIYTTDKIDSWMNNNENLVKEVFILFEDCLDVNFKNETDMLKLKKLLSDADGEIRKVQTILSEEKEGVKSSLATLRGEDNGSSTSSNNSSNKEVEEKDNDIKESEKTPVEENEEEDEFIDEDDKNTSSNNNTQSGRDDEASYVG